MAKYNGKPAGEVNRFMKAYLRETDGVPYADFPMNYGAKWLRGGDKVPVGPQTGEPAFIRTDNVMPSDVGVDGFRAGYVWGPGPSGFGYYHLTTKEAYKALEARLQVDAAPVCCFGQSKEKHE